MSSRRRVRLSGKCELLLGKGGTVKLLEYSGARPLPERDLGFNWKVLADSQWSALYRRPRIDNFRLFDQKQRVMKPGRSMLTTQKAFGGPCSASQLPWT